MPFGRMFLTMFLTMRHAIGNACEKLVTRHTDTKLNSFEYFLFNDRVCQSFFI
jgi:hypothetical protein